jgi:AraC-like DNA-binding protein
VRLFDGEVPKALHGLIDGAVNVSRVVGMRGDRTMRYLAGSLFGRGLNGPLSSLMMEGAVIQVLAAERAAIFEARERLLADMRQPPTLGDLALVAGLSEKRLNAGFRLLFGATVFEDLRNERLAHARIALQSDTASPKEVAFRVGYNHVCNSSTPSPSATARRRGNMPIASRRRCCADRRWNDREDSQPTPHAA